MAFIEPHDIKNYIKGKITEEVFELMFREGSDFTVIPFGYEKNFPEIAQFQNHLRLKRVIETLRRTPDFILESQDREYLYIVEVKHRPYLDSDEIISIAKRTRDYSQFAFLFLATPKGFYMGECEKIINHNGFIPPISHKWIRDENVVAKYLAILNEFEKS